MQSAQIESPAVRGCLDACARCEQILDALPAELYASSIAGRAPISAHLRHAVEHFFALERGLTSGVIDYDARDRDEAIERDSARFREALYRVRLALANLRHADLGARIVVRQTAAMDEEPSRLESTIQRELVFLSSHTIHHLAVIIGLCREQGVELSDDLALAFSTAAHRQATAS